AASLPAFALAACGATATPAPAATQPAGAATPTQAAAAPTAAAKGPVTLQYFFETGSRPANVEYMGKLGERYTAEVASNVKIEPVIAPEGLTADQKLETMVAGGTPPDVVYSGASVSMAARGAYLDIFPLLEKDGKSLDDQHPNARAVYAIKGGSFLWGLPNHLSTHFLVVNKTLLAEAGVESPSADWANPDWTWDAYVDAGLKVTKRDGDKVSTWGTFALGGNLFYDGPYMYGSKWYEGTTCLIDDPKAYGCFQFDHDTIYKHQIAPTAAQSQAFEGGFMTGKVGMQLDGPWSIVTYTTIKDFEWTLAPVPYASEMQVSDLRVNSAFCNSCAIASKNAVDESWEFMKWLYYNDDIYADWSWNGSGRLPSRIPGQAKWLELANGAYPDVAWSVYVDAYTYAAPDWSAKQANINKLTDLVTAELTDPVAGDANANIPELAAAIKPKIEALLEEV
ncbi:MAG: extracellular solute-binding protein, partial [Anaerolineae bacterium]